MFNLPENRFHSKLTFIWTNITPSFHKSLCPLLSRLWEWEAQEWNAPLRERWISAVNFPYEVVESKRVSVWWNTPSRLGYLCFCRNRTLLGFLWCEIMLWSWNEVRVSICWTLFSSGRVSIGLCSVLKGAVFLEAVCQCPFWLSLVSLLFSVQLISIEEAAFSFWSYTWKLCLQPR